MGLAPHAICPPSWPVPQACTGPYARLSTVKPRGMAGLQLSPGTDPGHQSLSPAPSCWPRAPRRSLARLGPCLSRGRRGEVISGWGTQQRPGYQLMSGAGRPPRPLGQPLLDAFCLQSLSCQGPRSHPSLELGRECRGRDRLSVGATTFVESWPGAGRGSRPSALQQWEGLLQKGPHPLGASSPGSPRGSCLPSSVQWHLLDSPVTAPDSSSDTVPQPRVRLGGGCGSPSQPQPPGL